MEIEDLETAARRKKEDVLIYPLGIAVTDATFKRWKNLNYRLKVIDRRLRLSDYARDALIRMMDAVEAKIAELERKAS